MNTSDILYVEYIKICYMQHIANIEDENHNTKYKIKIKICSIYLNIKN